MNRSGLAALLAHKKEITYVEADRIVRIIFNTMAETLKNEGRIEIRGFGAFTVKRYKSYAGRNPKTGAVITVKTKKLPTFRVGKELKMRVNY
jgi:integration host factor subunit beta